MVGWVLCISVVGEMVLDLSNVGGMVLGLSISWWWEVYQFVIGHCYAYLFGFIVAVGLSVDDGNVLDLSVVCGMNSDLPVGGVVLNGGGVVGDVGGEGGGGCGGGIDP